MITKYFHDRIVLLMLILNSVITITGILFVLFHLDSSKGSAYIIQCRFCDTAAHEFKGGSAFDMSSFIMFFVMTFGFAVAVSKRVYSERRHLALVFLMMSAILGVFATIVSYSLFSLR